MTRPKILLVGVGGLREHFSVQSFCLQIILPNLTRTACGPQGKRDGSTASAIRNNEIIGRILRLNELTFRTKC